MESQTSSSAGLKPGDLVEIHRSGYNHWGVYIGDGFIVHITSPDGISSAGSARGMSSIGISSVTSVIGKCGAVVKKEKLDVVAGKDKWNIGNHLDENYPPRPAQVIVKEALEFVGQTVPYGIALQNCEHFSNFLRYGLKISGQVDAAIRSVIEWAMLVSGYKLTEDETTTTMKKIDETSDGT